MIVVAIVAAWLGLMRFVSGSVGIVIVISPFFFLLYVLYRVIEKPFALACAFFGLHALACISSAILILQTTDGVERWVRSLPIILIDIPVTFVFAAWEPPGIVLPMYVFLVGGGFWALVGWGLARFQQAMHNSSLTTWQRRKSLLSSEKKV
jgi:hypothetical protein